MRYRFVEMAAHLGPPLTRPVAVRASPAQVRQAPGSPMESGAHKERALDLASRVPSWHATTPAVAATQDEVAVQAPVAGACDRRTRAR